MTRAEALYVLAKEYHLFNSRWARWRLGLKSDAEIIAYAEKSEHYRADLYFLADTGCGMHYESKQWRRMADRADWNAHWPIVDAEGLVCGVVESAETDNYFNVDDTAMVSHDDLTPKQITDAKQSGYANI